MNEDLKVLIKKSRMISWKNFGKNISFYHPGMFWYHGSWGEYPVLSITGNKCRLLCNHCKGKILESMISVTHSQDLLETCVRLEKKGAKGILISGGSAQDGSLPWNDFISGIHAVKEKTNLFISIHSGILEYKTADMLKKAGVDQALIDVIGDDETLRDVYHCDFGVNKIKQTLEVLQETGISCIPHIVIGLNYGKIKGEYKAIDMIRTYDPRVVTFVSLMPLTGTPMEKITPVAPEEIARIIAEARMNMPHSLISLGCARDRTNPNLDVLAVELGVNRIALPSDEAIEKAKAYGLTIKWQKTCCSLPILKNEKKD